MELKALISPEQRIVRISELHLVNDPVVKGFFKGSVRKVRTARSFHNLPVIKYSDRPKGWLYCDIEVIREWILTGGK